MDTRPRKVLLAFLFPSRGLQPEARLLVQFRNRVNLTREMTATPIGPGAGDLHRWHPMAIATLGMLVVILIRGLPLRLPHLRLLGITVLPANFLGITGIGVARTQSALHMHTAL